MDPVTILIAAALLITSIFFLLASDKKKAEIARRVNKLNGPTCYPIVGTEFPIMYTKRRDLFKFILTTQETFGPIYRTWSANIPQIHLLLPEHVEVILRSSEHLDKTMMYKFMQNWVGTGLITATGQKWHKHRKIIDPTFHFNILDSFVEVFSDKSEILINKLQKEVGSKGFDVCPYIAKCTLDNICETAMGTPIHAQDDRESDYAKAIHDISEIVIHRLFHPWLHSDFIFKMSANGKRQDECLGFLHGFTKKMIEERKVALSDLPKQSDTLLSEEDRNIGKKKRKAFLDLLLEASQDGVRLTEEELKDEVTTFMFGGHDTTSAGISWTLFLLGLHPDVQETAYEEQESIFQGSDRPVTMKELSEMKYLERVIKETLRLYPSVPFIGRMLKEDVNIGGYDIPSGCEITLHIYRVHRNPAQFPDPEKFDPDNFLPERVVNRHPYSYIPFSAGPRSCIGQKFAMLEMKTILSCVLRHYRLRSIDTRDTVNVMAELVLKSERGINLTITPRESGNGGI